MSGTDRQGSQLHTSESVSMGHPDKVADQISDAILDHCLKTDPLSRVACETLVTTDLVVVAGEITTRADLSKPTIDRIVRDTIREIGYVDSNTRFAADSCRIESYVHDQSCDIAMGVDIGGAGDQGIMFGFACNETSTLMPLPIYLAHRLVENQAKLRSTRRLPWLRPDAKSQVTIRYNADGSANRIHAVVFSTQHDDSNSVIVQRNGKQYFSDQARRELIDTLIRPTLESERPELIKGELTIMSVDGTQALQADDSIIPCLINPTGCFLVGGPHGDCGLTGRKIIVDTYGGRGRHGGGAFSGKDPTKVDRSASYMCRHIAKNVVAAGLASACEVQVAYVIGGDKPVSLRIDTFGTGSVSDHQLKEAVSRLFDLRPAEIIRYLDLRRPIYRKTARHGHFGREDEDFTWENTHRRHDLLQAVRDL